MVNRSQGQLIVPRQKDDKPLNVPLNAHSDAVLARRAGDGEPTGHIFRSQDWDHYRSAWEHALERAGLTNVHFHDLRHTFGSWLAQAGRTPKEIQEALGHTTLAMTNRYMHLAPSHLRAAVAVLDGVLDSGPTPSASAQTSAHDPVALEVVSQKSLS